MTAVPSLIDPALVHPAAIDPETGRFNGQLETTLAGRPTRAELAVYPGGVHAFNAFRIPIAADANARVLRFIADAVGT